MKYFFLLLLTLFLCLDLSAQALDALPTIDQPQEFDKIHTYTRGFSAAFRLDTLRKYFSADIVEGLAVDPYTAIPDSLRGRYFTSTLDSLYYVDYFGAFVNLTPGTGGGGGGGTWDGLTGIPDSIVYSAELAAAQQAAEDYADANDANTQNPFQTISKVGSTVTLSDGGGSFTDAVDDADPDPANELQNLTYNTSTLSLGISEGNSVDLSGIRQWTARASNEITFPNNIGLGTVTNPGKILDVETTGGADMRFKTTSSTSLSGGQFLNDVGSSWGLYARGSAVAGTIGGINNAGALQMYANGGPAVFGTLSNHPMRLMTGGNSRIEIATNGFTCFGCTGATQAAEFGSGFKLRAGNADFSGGRIINVGDALAGNEATNLAQVQALVAASDPDPANELQNLTYNTSTLSLGISEGNSVDLSGIRLWTSRPSNEITFPNNIGLGTVTNPGKILDVETTGGADMRFKTTSSTSLSGGQFLNDVGSSWGLYARGSAVAGTIGGINNAGALQMYANGGPAVFGTLSNHPMRLMTGGNSRIEIATNGFTCFGCTGATQAAEFGAGFKLRAGNADFSGGRIINVGDALAGNEATNLAQVQALVAASSDGNGIEDGGDVNVPLNTDVRGFSYPSSASFDTRIQIGHSTLGEYRNGMYSYDNGNFGFFNLRNNMSSSGVSDEAGLEVGHRASLTIADYKGNEIFINGSFSDKRINWEASNIRYFYDTGGSDFYELWPNSRPTGGPSVKVTETDGTTDWQQINTTVSKVLNADVSNNSTTTYATILSFDVQAGRVYSGSVKLWFTPVAGESMQLRISPTSGTISGDLVDIRDGTATAVTNNSPITITDYASTGVSSTTLDFTFTATATTAANIQFRKAATGSGFSHIVEKGTRVTVDYITE